MLNNFKTLTGYDTRGIVYDAGKFIQRKINSKHFDETMKIYNYYKEYNLEQYNIVKTEVDQHNKSLKHEKHIISYPHEWTANMFKDAALFHLTLFLNLDKYGLTLKDALPNNIVFDFYKPVFVDFFSILFKNKLEKEEWLDFGNYLDPRFAVFDKMFLPFFMIPLIIMIRKDYSSARKMLSERACNCKGITPSWRDLLSLPQTKSVSGFKEYANSMRFFKNVKINRFSCLKKSDGFINFCHYLLELINKTDVTPQRSAYVSYYEDKKEGFLINNNSEWKDKQKNVHSIISKIQPKRVLDLGANTGWFSILAESQGAEVIATDIDESATDSLYLYSKKNRLKILPLLISFNDLTREIYGVIDNNPAYQDRDFKSNPLFISAVERLKSDMVLALGLAHHLILGEGNKITNVFEILSKLAKETLVLEFIDIKDDLIKNEPSFFKNLNKYTKDTYNLKVFINSCKKYFKNVEVVESHPDTRKILLCKK